MSFKSSSLLCLALLHAFSCAIHAFYIKKLLNKYPEFSTFKNYLTQTNLVDQINSRNTITILAVDNGVASSISSKSQSAIKAIISTHIVLDYFDEKKLNEAIGLAVNQQGFIKVALVGEGTVGFGSVVKGSPINVELERMPYNISILKVSKLIIFLGADKVHTAKTPTVATKATVSSQSTKAPASSRKARAPSPLAEEGISDSPKEAGALEAEAPTPIASSPVAEALGLGDDDVANAQTPSRSSRIHIGFGAMMSFVSLLVVL
ncbi:hypothetical protein TanjilG_15725 [Lupinus angustifolius]|uniref:FAS1 domain-containing protein n=1 Tax=Lupinus angustifolius TaxID=3871 RepID=A0A1J7INN8_LUPAN|nr:hypothetical protein TanjilG_15725 [Lupinus angustifolius]